MKGIRLYAIVIAVLLLYSILQITFGEKLAANNGLGWDGYTYAQICDEGIQSDNLNHYLFFRIGPSLLIHTFYKIAGISFTPESIRIGFEWLNILCLVAVAGMAGNLFDRFQLPLSHQLAGYMLLFVNFFVLRFNFYYPVLTDVPGFALGVAVLFFYLRGEPLNLMLTGLISAFTWPPAAITTLPLFVFPYREIGFKSCSVGMKNGLLAIVALASGGIIYYVWDVMQAREYIAYALPVDRKWLYLSAGALVITISPLALLFQNSSLFNHKHTNIKGVAYFVLIVLITGFIYGIVNPPVAKDLNGMAYLLKAHWFFGLAKPFISIVSHFSYFGLLIPLLLIFWSSFSKYIGTYGLGLSIALFINLFLFGAKSESRVLVNVFGMLCILFTLFLSHIQINTFRLLSLFVLQFIASKCWFTLNPSTEESYFRPDGLIAWPYQQFYMHLGIYMTPEIWAVLLLSLLLFLGILSLLFFKPKWEKGFYLQFRQRL